MPTYVCKYCVKSNQESEVKEAYRKTYRHTMGCKSRGGAPNEGDRKPLVRCDFCKFVGENAREVKTHEIGCDSNPVVVAQVEANYIAAKAKVEAELAAEKADKPKTSKKGSKKSRK